MLINTFIKLFFWRFSSDLLLALSNSYGFLSLLNPVSVVSISIIPACVDELKNMLNALPSYINTTTDLVYEEAEYVGGSVTYICPEGKALIGSLRTNRSSVCTITNPTENVHPLNMDMIPPLFQCTG